MKRPNQDTYAPYYRTYTDLVPEGDLLARLGLQHEQTLARIEPLDDSALDHRYAEGKWSVRELIGHLVDCERIFASRALALARRDPTPLPGFDEDTYVANGHFSRRSVASLAGEWRALRQSNIHLFASFDEDTLNHVGVSNGLPMIVGAIPWIIAGHELHHRRILDERYLAS